MKYFILGLLCIIFIMPLPECAGKEDFSISQSFNGRVITVLIDDLFKDECLTDKGKQILFNINDIIGNNDVFIECAVIKKLNYNSNWEAANIYAYKTVKFLIQCCGIKPEKITYIGMPGFINDRIVFSIIK